MKKYFLILLVLASCTLLLRNEKKLQFISDFIRNPDQVERILAADSSFADEIFLKKHCSDSAKIKEFLNYIKPVIKNNYRADYKVICNREVNIADPKTGIIDHFHEITIEGNNPDKKIKFQWLLLNGRWRLFDIFIIASEYCRKAE